MSNYSYAPTQDEFKSISFSPALVPIISCLVIQLCVGILYLWSIFKSPIVEAFAWSTKAAGMVSSYMILSFVIGNLIGGFSNDKKGPKATCFIGVITFSLGICLSAFLTPSAINFLYLTYAVMGGIGSGIAYGACISCIQKWLPEKRGLASGLACGAFGLSTVIFTPLSNYLMNTFSTGSAVNFKMVFLFLSLVFAALGITACFFVKLSEVTDSFPDEFENTNTSKEYTLKEAVKTPAFWCLFFSIFFINGTWNLCVPLIKDLGIERGLSVTTAIACVSFTGITNALGRIFMSTVSDSIGRAKTMYVLCGLTFAGAVLTTFISGYGFFIAIAVIAFAYGGPSAINAALCTDLFGSKNSGVNYGVAMLALGLSSVFFNWISASVLHASVSNVSTTFIMGALTAVIPVFLNRYIDKTLKSN